MQSPFGIFSSPGPILFESGPFIIRWYGVLIALAVILGLNLSKYCAKKRSIDGEIIDELLPFLVISSLIGARAYYVIFEWDSYKNNIIESIAIWKGGIAIHGALIGGIIAILIFCKLKKQYFWDILDILVPSLALGQAIGRWGNFFNNEAYGLPTMLPWKIYIPESSRTIPFSSFEYFHPTFLYESLWNLMLFMILLYLTRKNNNRSIKLTSGTLSSIYLIIYSLGRIWIEGLRIDPLCLGGLPPACEGGIRMAQLMSIFLINIGIFIIWWLYSRKKSLPSFGTNKWKK